MTGTDTSDRGPAAEVVTGGDQPTPRPRRGWPFFAIIAVGVIAFLAGGAGGSYEGKLSSVQKNDNASYLPASAESTKASNEAAKFMTIESIPGFVVFHRPTGLTSTDKQAVQQAFTAISGIAGVDKQAMTPPQFSTDNTAASLYAPLVGKDNGVSVNGDDLADTEKRVLAAARTAAAVSPSPLETHSAGPGGLLVAFIDAFGGLDSTLLLTAVIVIFVILLLVYRSVILPFFPLVSAGLAIGLSSMVIYFLAKNETLTLTGQSQGILSVLVLGAGTDYALLLISRYREELHEFENPVDAMIAAWKASISAILASASTVIIGLLCLGFSQLASNKSLGPVAAIGIACTVLVMTTFLPLSLVLIPKIWFWPIGQLLSYGVPRLRAARPDGARGIFWLYKGSWVFWPKIPRFDHQTDLASHGLWGRIAAFVGRRHRPAWIAALLILFICLAGISSLKTNGLTTAQGFTNKPDAVVGQTLYDAKFDKGAGAPAVIVTNTSALNQVVSVASKTPGVSTKPGSVCVQIDFKKAAASSGGGGSSGAAPASSQASCPPAALLVAPIDGRIVVNATLADSYESPAAYETIKRLRVALHAIPGADVKVGGNSAANLDVQTASVHDRNLIIPIVLLVIFVILALLLRALLAPLLLIATVVLSFFATLGVCGFAFTHVFGFAGADQSFPLFAFVFLVALGIDYNIFLMTRVREETMEHGTRSGVLRGLSVTGGVITSAGVVLAATFTVLGILPLVFLAEIGFAVAFGVLLDTILVRSILVPALTHDIGRMIWWPSKLSRAAD
ncbi:MAG: mmpL6 [Frankiales bacterium]|nr:mmpL6 [Frankiales bacterium]